MPRFADLFGRFVLGAACLLAFALLLAPFFGREPEVFYVIRKAAACIVFVVAFGTLRILAALRALVPTDSDAERVPPRP